MICPSAEYGSHRAVEWEGHLRPWGSSFPAGGCFLSQLLNSSVCSKGRGLINISLIIIACTQVIICPKRPACLLEEHCCPVSLLTDESCQDSLVVRCHLTSLYLCVPPLPSVRFNDLVGEKVQASWLLSKCSTSKMLGLPFSEFF